MEMTKIVNGKLYNTDTSTILYNDRLLKRVYYVTAKGNYYVLYSKTNVIVPMTEDEMKEILMDKAPEVYLELWPGEIEEA